MNRLLAAVLLAAYVLVAAGCQGNVVLTRLESPVEMPIDLPYPDSDAVTLQLAAPAGDVEIGPGAETLVSGAITYNIQQWAPRSSVEGDTVRLEQTQQAEGIPPSDTRNDWRLTLGASQPYDLSVNLGAASTDLDLSGLPLTGFSFTSGAGDSHIQFNLPNPQRMTTARVDAGAGETTLSGLLNTNFERLEVAGGAGTLEVRFDGGPLGDSSTAEIRGGVGEIVIGVDPDAPIRVEASTGLGGLVVANDLIQRDDGYETPGYAEAANRLDVTVTVGVGRVRIETE